MLYDSGKKKINNKSIHLLWLYFTTETLKSFLCERLRFLSRDFCIIVRHLDCVKRLYMYYNENMFLES